jgi:hypothetical protein
VDSPLLTVGTVSRKLKYDIPGRDFRIYLDEYGEPPSIARWEEIFAPDVQPPLDLVVDIGFGRGEFLIDAARKEPHRAFVGIERSFKRTLKMARRLARLTIGNVRLVESTAQAGIPEFFPERSIESAWINFPDPWPKDRHAARRLVQAPFIRDLALRSPGNPCSRTCTLRGRWVARRAVGFPPPTSWNGNRWAARSTTSRSGEDPSPSDSLSYAVKSVCWIGCSSRVDPVFPEKPSQRTLPRSSRAASSINARFGIRRLRPSFTKASSPRSMSE